MGNTSNNKVSETKKQSGSPKFFYRLLREHPLGFFGFIIVLAMIIIAIFSPTIAPYGANEYDYNNMFQSPSTQHPLGTDQLGRDVLSRLIFGARITIVVGLSATTIGLLLSIILGVTSGYFGGVLDILLQRLVDAWMSFPAFILLITVMSLIGSGTVQIIAVLGVLVGIVNSRVIRGVTISITQNMYVQAAQATGCSSVRIIIKHIIPNIMAPVIILFSTTIGGMILTESTISFLGYGVSPQTPSWGNMLSLEGRKYMELYPSLALWPGLAIAITVFGINMLGDAVRDILDPRLKSGSGSYMRKIKLKIKSSLHP